jgi:hypothetical protein
MEKAQVVDLVNIGITVLCESCDPNCAKAVSADKLPHCYRARNKVPALMQEIMDPALSDEQSSALDEFFKTVSVK